MTKKEQAEVIEKLRKENDNLFDKVKELIEQTENQNKRILYLQSILDKYEEEIRDKDKRIEEAQDELLVAHDRLTYARELWRQGKFPHQRKAAEGVTA